MKRVKSSALDDANEILGLTGKGSGVTEFMDGTLDQVVDMIPIIRRSRTIGPNTGIFGGQWFDTHVGSGTRVLSIDPYAVDGFNAWPNPIPRGFDVWLLWVSGFLSVNGTLVGARWGMTFGAEQKGFGGAAAAAGHPAAFWDGNTNIAGNLWMTADADVATISQRVMQRVPRGVVVNLESQLNAAGTITVNAIIGLFPAGLGQDAAY